VEPVREDDPDTVGLEEWYQGYDQVNDTRWADMYDHDDLDGANTQINNWYNDVVLPKLNEHRDFVIGYYLGVAEDENDQLLATCEKGTQCRVENEAKYRGEIETQWQTVINHFREDIVTAMRKTETLVNDGWDVAVQCQIDHPCCEFNSVEWDNMQKKIETFINKIIEKESQVVELERRITEMELECVSYNLPWDQYRATADQRDVEAAAAGIDYNDVTALDETLVAEMAAEE